MRYGPSAPLASLSAAVLALAAGCAPALGGDGYYACVRGSCPASAPVCGADGRCHAGGSDGSVAADGGADGGVIDDAGADAAMPLAYDSCNGTVAGACGADLCYYEASAGFDPTGYCTRSCTTDAECPAYRGSASACIQGRCARGCAGDSDCPFSLACATGRWRDDAALRLCVTIDLADPGSYDTCTTDANCPRPLSCIAGSCQRPCTISTDCISDLETCVASMSGASGCLYDCANVSDCDFLGDMLCTSHTCRPTPTW
ncbi:MAG: hypothetical protein U0234_16935 [Sandaracinus sp.]